MSSDPHSHDTTPSSRGVEPSARSFERVLGDFQGALPGPSVIIIGGLHGNEPAGVLACERLAQSLERLERVLAGRVVLLAGNRRALAIGRRFLQRDLNRGWKREKLLALRARARAELRDEDEEQLELFERIVDIERSRRGPVIGVDLHTTSGRSAPFVCFGDTLDNRELAACLPTTAILGLEEVIEGAIAGYFTDEGHVGLGIEAGQHQDPAAVDRHVAAVMVLLVAAGNLRASDVTQLVEYRRTLEQASRGYPRVVEVRHRHVVAPGDDFTMLPGFGSFTPVRRRQIVARDVRGDVRAPEAGLMLMPRYQRQGEDGYFLVREVRPVWLAISKYLRRAGAGRLWAHVPGVEVDPDNPGVLVVSPRLARARVIDALHLCGYRRTRTVGARSVYAQRSEAERQAPPYHRGWRS